MTLMARAGDGTAHGTPLSPGGSPNVLVGGRPAWRAAVDTHTCPLTSGTVPHVGGVVSQGEPTVLINGFPATSVGDTIVENGPPNRITTGCPSVRVGTNG
jgi:uncharacterized Zn-binding protein involved in type VI secretion